MIISQTPLRVSFAGGGTDFHRYYREHEGAVVSSAIDKYVYVVVVPRFDELIIVNYTKKETVESVADLKHELVREALLRTGVENGVEITTTGRCAVGRFRLGIFEHRHRRLAACDLRLQGQSGHRRAARPRSLRNRDRYLRQAHRQAGPVHRGLWGSVPVHFPQRRFGGRETLPPLGGAVSRPIPQHHAVLHRPHAQSREHTGRAGSAHRRQSGTASQFLKALAFRTAEALDRMRLWEVGRVLNDGWQLKRQLADGISDPEIEGMYDLALSAGAAGGKICGAGGGGFLLLYCDPAHHKAVRKAMEAYRELPIALDPDGSKIIFQNRAGYRMASV